MRWVPFRSWIQLSMMGYKEIGLLIGYWAVSLAIAWPLSVNHWVPLADAFSSLGLLAALGFVSSFLVMVVFLAWFAARRYRLIGSIVVVAMALVIAPAIGWMIYFGRVGRLSDISLFVYSREFTMTTAGLNTLTVSAALTIFGLRLSGYQLDWRRNSKQQAVQTVQD